jgi:hypothetical protein
MENFTANLIAAAQKSKKDLEDLSAIRPNLAHPYVGGVSPSDRCQIWIGNAGGLVRPRRRRNRSDRNEGFDNTGCGRIARCGKCVDDKKISEYVEIACNSDGRSSRDPQQLRSSGAARAMRQRKEEKQSQQRKP